MGTTDHEPAKWNIFARELESILHHRGYRLGHLNDRSHIHPEKVRRLQQSLRVPRFNLLSPDELELVSIDFGFTYDERLRLRAAILATAVEDLLMSRIEADDALTASEQVFDVLLVVLRTQSDDNSGMGAVKGLIQIERATSTSAVDPQDALDSAITDIDRAYLLLHLAYIGEPTARFRFATQAQDTFSHTLTSFERLDVSVLDVDEWAFWRNEAQRGLKLAEQCRLDANPSESD